MSDYEDREAECLAGDAKRDVEIAGAAKVQKVSDLAVLIVNEMALEHVELMRTLAVFLVENPDAAQDIECYVEQLVQKYD